MANINLLNPKGLLIGLLYIIFTILYVFCIFVKFNFISVTLKNFNTIVLLSIVSFMMTIILKFIIFISKDIHTTNNKFSINLLVDQPIIVTVFILIMITLLAIKIISMDTVWMLLQDFLDITDNTLTILLNVSKYTIFVNAFIEIIIIIYASYSIVITLYYIISNYLKKLYKSKKTQIKKKYGNKTNAFLDKMKTTVQKTVHLRVLLDIKQHKYIIKKLFNNKITIFDIRTPFEIRNGHVCNALLLYDFVNDYEYILKYKILDLIKKNKKDIVIYDSNGKRSNEIAELLHSKGFVNKIYIIQNGGYNDLGILLDSNKICKLCR